MLLLVHYKNKWNELPLKGQLNEKPWSGDYWATIEGGISFRWNNPRMPPEERSGYDLLDMDNLGDQDLKLLSPSEKYDLFMGDKNWSLTKYERKRTKVMKLFTKSNEYVKGFTIPRWFGLCHSWAPATILYKSPGPIVVKGKTGLMVPFGASDIKALLTLNMDIHDKKNKRNRRKTRFLGSRCELDIKKIIESYKKGELTENEFKKKIDVDSCNDTHPAAFHISLANLIGHRKMGFVLDMDRGQEVWNQGVYSYESKVEKMAKIDPKYSNSFTTKKYTIFTSMTFVKEVLHSWKGGIDPKAFKTKEYRYELYLNEDEEILGGKWISDERPDFLWMREMPSFDLGLAGMRTLYNQSTNQDYGRKKKNIKQLMKLWRKKTKDTIKLKRALRFVNNTKELVNLRKEGKIEYLNKIKGNMNNFLKKYVEAERMAKIKEEKKRRRREAEERKSEEERARRVDSDSQEIYQCTYTQFTSNGLALKMYKKSAKGSPEKACQKAEKACKNRLTAGKYCRKGKRNLFKKCTYKLMSNYSRAPISTFKRYHENKKHACEEAKKACISEARWGRKCIQSI